MKLLIVAQKVNVNDPVLGFFHGWVKSLADRIDLVTVICLEAGEYALPANVVVCSLGKETSDSRFKYLWRFAKYLWQERNNYDAVLVHMNQEYILVAGWWWYLTGKKVFMWRNHHAGNWLTDLAAKFCTKVFCTSKFSFTAKYKKTVLMPIGIDLDLFQLSQSVPRAPRSILFLGRLAPVKKVAVFVEALAILDQRQVSFQASIYGNALPVDQGYALDLAKRAVDADLMSKLNFSSGLAHHLTPAVYQRHELYVNLSSSGMYDKTIFEALASGCLVLAANRNLSGQLDDRQVLTEVSAEALADRLALVFGLSDEVKTGMIERGKYLAGNQGLGKLSESLVREML